MNYDLCNPAVVRGLMETAGIRFRRDFGQNFLINADIPVRIAESCSDKSDIAVLEIGPGIGCLTKQLALRYKKVIAVEIDKGLLPVLDRTLEDFDNVTIVSGDIMKLDIAELLLREAAGMEIAVCANLPYYITTPILMRLLESGIPFSSITVMVQAEVATRLTAEAGSAEYGAITAVIGYYGMAKRLFTVSAGSFMPAPKVNSAVVRIALYKEPPYTPKDTKLFFSLIRAAFGQRRKTLVNAVNAALPDIDKSTLTEALAKMNLSQSVRGERLSTAEFSILSDLLSNEAQGE